MGGTKANAGSSPLQLCLETLASTELLYEISISAMAALIRISAMVEETTSIDALADGLLDILSEELEVENSSLMIKEDDGKFLRLFAGRGKGDHFLPEAPQHSGRRIRIGQGIAGIAAAEGRYIFVPDITKDPRCGKFSADVAVRSLMSVPLRVGTQIYGVLNFSHPDPEKFCTNNIRIFLLVADFTGRILTLAQLHRKLQDWNTLLRREVEEKTAELQEKNQELTKLAMTDPLTGSGNRRFFFTRFQEELARAVRYNEHFCLVLFDLDNLKQVNDRHGHPAGDKALTFFASILTESGRTGDVAARIGGDEFACLLIEANEVHARDFFVRVREKAERFMAGKDAVPLGVSAGAACSTQHKWHDHLAMYQEVDHLLYQAKQTKNTIVIHGGTGS